MANLVIPDEALKEAGLDQHEALVEFSCRLFATGRLTLWSTVKLAGLDRNSMEDALLDRGIPLYRILPSDLAQDLATLSRLGL